MKFKELMLTSLQKMLQPGETLMHPIYGILQLGNASCYGFFAFTQSDLLVALTEGNRIVNQFRVPLNVTAVGIRKSAVTRQHTIDISFSQGAPMKIIAFPKVMTIDTQKENFPRFLDHLKSLCGGRAPVNPAAAEGEMIRMQYFNAVIWVSLAFLPMIPIIWVIMDLRKGTLNPAALSELFTGILTVFFILTIPLVLLSFLNRFFFGRVVACAAERGLVVEGQVIPWKDIRLVTYTPQLQSSRRKTEYTYATLHIAPAGQTPYTLDVLHFPVYGLKLLKKHLPDIKVQLTGKGRRTILIWALLPTVISVVLALVK